MPSIVLCTSGTAAAHFHAAVVEAHLSGIPLLVLTADRPPELRDVGAPQTIDQTKLYGDAVRWFHDPGVASMEAAHTWRSLARHALDSTLGPAAGPAHLNLSFREPLVADAYELPAAHLGPYEGSLVPAAPDLARLSIVEHARGVIVAGRGVDDPAAVEALAVATGWPVLADPRSGCRGTAHAVSAFDGVLRHEGFARDHRPDVVLHLGEPPASKVAAQWLASLEAVQVRVSPRVGVIDPAHRVSHRITAVVSSVCHALAAQWSTPIDAAWFAGWRDASVAAESAIAAQLDDGPLDEPAVARCVSRVSGQVVVASSMPIRDVEWFGVAEPTASVWSNRGANGIDGTIATAVGVAVATGEPVTVLLGDVALLHDSSSLTALARRDVVVRIVVVDNDGGGIFSFLPQATGLDGARFEQLFGTPHGTDLVALARAHGLPAVEVTTRSELDAALAHDHSVLVRVASDRAANVERHAALQSAIVVAVEAVSAR